MADDVISFESSFETSSSNRPRRMDVIPAGAGRRRWTAEARARVVAESCVPGANVSEVARRHGMMPQQLYGWRRGLGKPEAIGFVPVALEPSQADDGGPPSSIGSNEIVVRASGMTIQIPAGVSADHIERVLLAVRVSA